MQGRREFVKGTHSQVASAAGCIAYQHRDGAVRIALGGSGALVDWGGIRRGGGVCRDGGRRALCAAAAASHGKGHCKGQENRDQGFLHDIPSFQSTFYLCFFFRTAGFSPDDAPRPLLSGRGTGHFSVLDGQTHRCHKLCAASGTPSSASFLRRFKSSLSQWS